MFFLAPQTGGALQLEDGSGNLLLESGDTLVLESFSTNSGVGVWDENPVLAILYSYSLPYLFFEQDPEVFAKFAAAWQNQSTQLMPEYTSEQLYGAIHNYPDFFMQLSTPVFSPDGTGVRGPGKVLLVSEGAGNVTIVGNA